MVETGHYDFYSGEDLEQYFKDKIDRYSYCVNKLQELYQRPDHRMAIKSIEGELKENQLKAEIMAGIEKDEKGKQIHSNQAKREVRGRQILKDDLDHQALVGELTRIQRLQNEIEISRRELDTEVRSLQVIIPALSKVYDRETLKIKLNGGLKNDQERVSRNIR